MTKRKTYHVVPAGDDWKVEAAQAKRAAGVFENKDEAVKRAIELAKAQELGQVIIHKRDGTIQEERTYGADPFPPKG
jgi:hypothetical protein